MKRYFIFLILVLLLSNKVFMQSQTAGTFSIQAGYDFNIHATAFESNYNGLNLERDTSAAGTSMFAISALYNPLNWLTGGITFEYGSYIEDPDDAEANGNTTGIIAFDLRAYPINGEKFNLYLGTELGYSFLEINRIYTFLGSQESQYKYKGAHAGLFAGFNLYFTPFLGWYLQFEYTDNNFELKEYTINNEPFNLTDWNILLNTYSVGLRTGLCFKFDL